MRFNLVDIIEHDGTLMGEQACIITIDNVDDTFFLCRTSFEDYSLAL